MPPPPWLSKPSHKSEILLYALNCTHAIAFFETLYIGKEKLWHQIFLFTVTGDDMLSSCRKQSAEWLFKWFLDVWMASDEWLFLYDGKRLNKTRQTELFLNIKIVCRSPEMRLKSLWIDGNRKSRPTNVP